MKLFIASDHAGVELKKSLCNEFQDEFSMEDLGPFSSESVDYPDYAHTLCYEMANEPNSSFGILICGSGNGMTMAANKHDHIRAALCWNDQAAALARQHNEANVLCIPARFISTQAAVQLAKVFLETEFDGGRHTARVEKIVPSELDEEEYEDYL